VAIVAETFAPGANLSEVARRHALNRGLLFTESVSESLDQADRSPSTGAIARTDVCTSRTPPSSTPSAQSWLATSALPDPRYATWLSNMRTPAPTPHVPSWRMSWFGSPFGVTGGEGSRPGQI